MNVLAENLVQLNLKSLGEKIRIARKQNHLTQEGLGEKLNTVATHLSNIERGEKSPSLELVINLANYFHLSLDYLLQDSLIYRKHQSKIYTQYTERIGTIISDMAPEDIESCIDYIIFKKERNAKERQR